LRKLSFIALTGLLFVFGCKEKSKGPDKFDPNAPVTVDITVIENQQVQKLIEVNGSVLSNDYVELHPETSGRVTFIQIAEGKVVPAGTVLVKLNDADLQAQLEKIKVQLELAQITEQRNKQLLNVRGINQSDYDISLQQVKSYKADLAYTQSLIDKTVIKAPFTGMLGLRQISLGAFINTTTTVATLQKVDNLKIDFTVPELYKNLVKVGTKVKIETVGAEKNKIEATIAAIEPQIIASSRNLKVRATVKANLLPGTFTKVYLSENAKNAHSIMVPSSVVIPDSKSKQVVVFRKGVAAFVNIETGYRTKTAVEITKGLEVGDSLVVAGMSFVRQDNKLKVGKVFSNAEIIK
jgi:membrane fusion protein (multidrug efflux system)